jgi:hypothetical protein
MVTDVQPTFLAQRERERLECARVSWWRIRVNCYFTIQKEIFKQQQKTLNNNKSYVLRQDLLQWKTLETESGES